MFSCEYRENFNNVSFERRRSPTDFESYLFEVEQITKKKQNKGVLRRDIRRRIQNLANRPR